MDNVESRVLEHHQQDLYKHALISNDVVQYLRYKKTITLEEKNEIMACQKNDQRIRKITNLLKKRKGGFVAFGKALLVERIKHEHLVEKLNTTLRKFKKTIPKPRIKNDPSKSIPCQNEESWFERSFKIMHGNNEEVSGVPGPDDFRQFEDYLKACKSEACDNTSQKKDVLSLIKKLKEDKLTLQRGLDESSRRNQELQARENGHLKRIEELEQHIRNLKVEMENDIKEQVRVKVKERLLGLDSFQKSRAKIRDQADEDDEEDEEDDDESDVDTDDSESESEEEEDSSDEISGDKYQPNLIIKPRNVNIFMS